MVCRAHRREEGKLENQRERGFDLDNELRSLFGKRTKESINDGHGKDTRSKDTVKGGRDVLDSTSRYIYSSTLKIKEAWKEVKILESWFSKLYLRIVFI